MSASPVVVCVGPRSHPARRLFSLGAAILVSLSSLVSLNAAAAQTSLWPALPEAPSAIQVRPNIGQGVVALYGLGRLDSRDNESKVDFLKRVARTLSDFTAQTGFEACAPIGENAHMKELAGRWIAPMMSNGSHVACTSDETWLGHTAYTNETIHSHPNHETEIYRINQSDQMLLHAIHGVYFPKGKPQRYPRPSKSGDPFSEQDRTSGNGWLVTDGQLYQQEDGGTRAWGSIATSPDHPDTIALGQFSSSGGRTMTYWDSTKFIRRPDPSAMTTDQAINTAPAAMMK